MLVPPTSRTNHTLSQSPIRISCIFSTDTLYLFVSLVADADTSSTYQTTVCIPFRYSASLDRFKVRELTHKTLTRQSRRVAEMLENLLFIQIRRI